MDGRLVDLGAIDRRSVARVGGKAANLGEVLRLEGTRVPPGFCVTTDAFRSAVSSMPEIAASLEELHRQPAGTPAALAAGATLRERFEHLTLPDDLASAIAASVGALGAGSPLAVRSSATAEDLPTASFAGQQDSHLNVIGAAQVLAHVVRCWASMFTDRAVAYRLQRGIDHRRVEMAVIVQRLVAARSSGVLFTADPLSGSRRTAVVESTFGLGEALVSGRVNPDRHHVVGGRVVRRAVATKSTAVRPAPSGGTSESTVDPAVRSEPSLDDPQILELVAVGRRIEAHFGRPQDIEWCVDADGIHIVQSRPITTLFPVPDAPDDANRVYVSVGHVQMMTEAMTPLGLSVWKLTSPAPMRAAGGRLFVDVTDRLASPSARVAMLEVFGRSDPLLRDALETVLERDDFVLTASDGDPPAPQRGASGSTEPLDADPEIVDDLVRRSRESIERLRAAIRPVSGPELFDFVAADLTGMGAQLFDPRSHQAVMAGIEAAWWLDEHLLEWLGERHAADVLSLSVPNNVSSEMGLALLDVADAIRPHPDVIAFLRDTDDDRFLEALDAIPGGPTAAAALGRYLDEYGMRCVGEIDIGRPRWAERPTALLPMLLSNVEHFEPGERRRRVERGQRRAAAKQQEVLARLRRLPGGDDLAARTERMIDRLRTFIGYREHPKYAMVSRYFVHKQAILAEATKLVESGVLDAVDDAYHLAFDELHEAVRTGSVDRALITERRDHHRAFASLRAPRVLTSDGEVLNGEHRRGDPPPGAVLGVGVSGGTVEGRARVVLDIADAHLEPGDILITRGTDPSWSPLFVGAAGLVTEVGGAMTHGAVVAREYGLVAAVGVDSATRLFKDGDRIRVDGTHGYVQLIER